MASRGNPLPSFLFFLLSGQTRITMESSSSRKWVHLECGPFSQNSLAFHPHVPAVEVIPLQGAWDGGTERENVYPFNLVAFFGSHYPDCPQNESGRGREGEPNLAPRSLGWEEPRSEQGITSLGQRHVAAQEGGLTENSTGALPRPESLLTGRAL